METVGITPFKNFGHGGEERIRAVVRGGPDFTPQIATQRTHCH